LDSTSPFEAKTLIASRMTVRLTPSCSLNAVSSGNAAPATSHCRAREARVGGRPPGAIHAGGSACRAYPLPFDQHSATIEICHEAAVDAKRDDRPIDRRPASNAAI
jgi:hypothetical protein